MSAAKSNTLRRLVRFDGGFHPVCLKCESALRRSVCRNHYGYGCERVTLAIRHEERKEANSLLDRFDPPNTGDKEKR